jgi:hypothetical protein
LLRRSAAPSDTLPIALLPTQPISARLFGTRLADAYLGTRTLKELFGLLDSRGRDWRGVGRRYNSRLLRVRGSSSPDDNTIMMAPGHETGFGLFTNVAIDQHIDARERENDPAVVMNAHPELLGLGLDQSTSITVHGDVVTVDGPKRVAVWDGKDHNGKGYYYLRTGDTPLASYAGTYQMAPHVYMTITLEGEKLVSQLTGQVKAGRRGK